MTGLQRLRLLATMLALLCTLNILDYFLTLNALAAGLREANPLMRAIVDTPAFTLVKLVLIPLLLWQLWRMRRRVKVIGLAVVWIVLAAYTFTIFNHGALIMAGIVPPLVP
ncbi:MAG: DUF5658 family protein [Clostridia bacterium]